MTELDLNRLPSLMQEWLDYTSVFPTTKQFNLWSCIAAIGGAMQRRCWIVTAGRQLFPNTFILLISPPGVGKTDAITTTREVWGQFMNLPIAPLSMTGKGIVDELASEKSIQTITVDGEQYRYSSLLTAAAELGTLIQEYDMTQISIFNELYDCNSVYNERTRGGGEVSIERPHISMLLGTQPKFIGHVFPETAFGMGLTSRMIMVYDDTEQNLDLFGDTSASPKKFKQLVQKFKPVATMKGRFDVDEGGKAELQRLHNNGLQPRPDAIKLAHYNTRRTAHLIKLSMIVGAANHGMPVITADDVQTAFALLLDVEVRMGEVFTEMSNVAEADIIRETFHFLIKKYNENERKPLPASVLHSYLQQRVPAWKIEYLISSMTKSGNIKLSGGRNAPTDMQTIVPGHIS